MSWTSVKVPVPSWSVKSTVKVPISPIKCSVSFHKVDNLTAILIEGLVTEPTLLIIVTKAPEMEILAGKFTVHVGAKVPFMTRHVLHKVLAHIQLLFYLVHVGTVTTLFAVTLLKEFTVRPRPLSGNLQLSLLDLLVYFLVSLPPFLGTTVLSLFLLFSSHFLVSRPVSRYPQGP